MSAAARKPATDGSAGHLAASRVDQDWDDADRWYLVVLVTPDGKADGGLSRRMPDATGEPFRGPWGLLTEEEAQALADAWKAQALADAWTAGPRDPAPVGTVAQVVEVFRFDGDPVWTEA